MGSFLVRTAERRATRRVVRAACQAVSTGEFRLVGEQILDACTDGVLVACDTGVALGEEVVLSFQMPGSGIWYDAETEVSRIVEGFRTGDPGYCAGLRFTHIERRTRLELGADLHALPLATPTRRLRTDYAKTILAIWGPPSRRFAT